MMTRIFFLIFVMIAGVIPAHAQNLIDATDENLIVKFMQDEGFRAKLEVLDDGDPVIRSNNSGTRFSIYFYGCTRGTACTDITFFVAYDLPDGLTFEQANAFNADMRFGRMYLDDEMDPLLEFDVNLDNGTTNENLADSLEIWLDSMGALEEFMDNRDR